MRLYTSTGTVKVRDQCNEYGVGLLMVDKWRNPDQWPFFAVDNGCYAAHSRQEEWDPKSFLGILARLSRESRIPDFVVIPDRVSDPTSLGFSEAWIHALKTTYPWFPYYLAVQDGMTEESVRQFIEANGISGIFVGGSMDWKLRTMGQWAKLAHRLGLHKFDPHRFGPLDAAALQFGARDGARHAVIVLDALSPGQRARTFGQDGGVDAGARRIQGGGHPRRARTNNYNIRHGRFPPALFFLRVYLRIQTC